MAQAQHPHPAVILVLKSLMALLLAFAAAIQIWLLPAISADFAADAPEFAYLRIPYLIVCELLMVGFDAALIAIWRLLSLVASSSVVCWPITSSPLLARPSWRSPCSHSLWSAWP